MGWAGLGFGPGFLRLGTGVGRRKRLLQEAADELFGGNERRAG
jgi:hypothetical protein